MKSVLNLALASISLLCMPALLKAQSSNVAEVVKASRAYEQSQRTQQIPATTM